MIDKGMTRVQLRIGMAQPYFGRTHIRDRERVEDEQERRWEGYDWKHILDAVAVGLHRVRRLWVVNEIEYLPSWLLSERWQTQKATPLTHASSPRALADYFAPPTLYPHTRTTHNRGIFPRRSPPPRGPGSRVG